MVVKSIEILAVDKNYDMRLRLRTDEGAYTFWGYIDERGKIYNQEGRVVARIKPTYAQALREVARVRLQTTFASSKKEVEDVLCSQDEGL
ncbi:MAG: hypothetical protein QW733_01915 [Desulfurococcaceae archaeon]